MVIYYQEIKQVCRTIFCFDPTVRCAPSGIGVRMGVVSRRRVKPASPPPHVWFRQPSINAASTSGEWLAAQYSTPPSRQYSIATPSLERD